MGQSVRSMAKVGDAAAIQADKNGHKKDQDGDVTQFLFGQNSDNSSTAIPLPSDEPSMSFIVDTQANNIQTDNTANDLGSGDASARLFSKRPWIGCQPLPLSDSRGQFTASSTSIVTAATTMIKGGEEARGGGTDGGATKMSSQSRARSAAAKARLRKTSSSILNDISFGALLVDQKNSSFKDIQEQQGIQKFISLVANSSSHAKTQADVETTFATTATTTAQKSTTNSPEMEQLITMMKNHKVSEESEDRISNTNNGNKNTRSIAIPKSTKITPTNNKKKDPSESNLCNGLQIDQADPKYAYLKSRKILPLPKPRLKKSTADSSNVQIAPSPNGNDASLFKDVYNTTEQTERENSKKMRHSISPSISLSSSSNQAPHYHNILSNASSFDFSIDKLKQLPLQHQKQRQALDPITIKLDLDKSKQTVNVSAKSKENKLHKSTLSSKVASSDTKPANTGINKQPKRSPNAKKKKKGKMAVQSPPPPPPLPEQPSSRKAPNKKGQRNQQKKKWDDDFSNAPGGFLSSDITLFDNPLSDDWMCLFCQYEVLCYGLEATKRKNGYYRRKRERLQREASRRLMHHEPSDSDDELVFKDERHIRAS